jgi:ABC-type transport system involved in multi-copper enzyme maturation permease subunit
MSLSLRSEIQNWVLDLHTWLAIAAAVWKRVIDPMMTLVLVGGAVCTFLLGISIENTAREIRGSLLLIQLFVTLIMIFVGSIEIPRDISTKNVQFFLSKALGRGTYLIGKFLGILFLGLIFFGTFAGAFACGNLMHFQWNSVAFGMTTFQLALQLMPLAALLVAVSVFLTEMASTIFAITFYILALMVFLIPAIAQMFLPNFLYPLPMVFYYALPNWQHYLWIWEGASRFEFLVSLTAYSFAYCAMALLVADFRFSRRDLN